MSSIIKLCADHLRAFSYNYNAKLKSAHAHELVAAIFGYKSKAAMLADTLFPIDNLVQAQFLVLTPSLIVDQRRKCLDDLPPELPNSSILAEELFTYLILEKRFSGRSFGVWKHLVDVLTTEYLLVHGSSILPMNFGHNEIARSTFDKPADEYRLIPDITGNEVKLIATNIRYASSDINFQSIDVTTTIKLKRIAGHVGYASPEISIMDNSKLSISQGVSI